MSPDHQPPTRCPSCRDLEERAREAEERAREAEERAREAEERAREAEAQVREREKRIDALEAQIARLKKNSKNSSKPPSSDIVKKKRKAGKGKRGKRKRGGQPGHPRHERKPFALSEIDTIHHWYWESCPCCGGELEIREGLDRIFQQAELIEKPVEIHEYRSAACWCSQCQKTHHRPIPEDVRKAGLTGPRLTALVAYMKVGCHCSFSTIRKYLRDVIGVRVSRGHLRNLCAKVSESLQGSYDELLDLLTNEAVLNVDETGHKDDGKRFWTWCFHASLFTVYRISPSRGTEVLLDVLGEEFAGLLGCDYFSAYRKYMRLNENVLVQFCLAHLIRDVKFLAEHPDPRNRAYGQQLVDLFRKLFGIIHRRDQYKTEESFRRALEDVEARVLWYATIDPPETREAANMAKRLNTHGTAYFRFITNPDIEPTNNLAEQAIRFVAIHRRMTQGTRGEWGREWCERMWTVITTCSQQSRSVFEFICESVTAFFAGKTGPSLAPDT